MNIKCCTKCGITKPEEQFSLRDSVSGKRRAACKICASQSFKIYRSDPKIKEHHRNAERARARANPEPSRKRARKYYAENTERARIRNAECARRRAQQPDYRERERLRQRDYAARNPEKVLAKANKRRAIKLRAMPPWLTDEHLRQIKEKYAEAVRLTKITGIKHHVDHIYPLSGINSSGLHVPWNLQVITASENCSKGNKILSESIAQ